MALGENLTDLHHEDDEKKLKRDDSRSKHTEKRGGLGLVIVRKKSIHSNAQDDEQEAVSAHEL